MIGMVIETGIEIATETETEAAIEIEIEIVTVRTEALARRTLFYPKS
jgi:hypothetical protein